MFFVLGQEALWTYLIWGKKCLQGKKSLKIRSLNSSRRRVRPRGPTTPFPSSGVTRYLVSRGPAGDTHHLSHNRREVL